MVSTTYPLLHSRKEVMLLTLYWSPVSQNCSSFSKLFFELWPIFYASSLCTFSLALGLAFVVIPNVLNWHNYSCSSDRFITAIILILPNFSHRYLTRTYLPAPCIETTWQTEFLLIFPIFFGVTPCYHWIIDSEWGA